MRTISNTFDADSSFKLKAEAYKSDEFAVFAAHEKRTKTRCA